jgi:hypothetical protein
MSPDRMLAQLFCKWIFLPWQRLPIRIRLQLLAVGEHWLGQHLFLAFFLTVLLAKEQSVSRNQAYQCDLIMSVDIRSSTPLAGDFQVSEAAYRP